MSLEQECRRRPDIQGSPVKLRNGEDWLIEEAEDEPIFEKEDGQWMFKGLGVGEPFKGRFERIRELWTKAAEKDSLPRDLVEELTKLTMELAAMALDQNYDLTGEQLGKLIDPSDQGMCSAIVAAIRGMDLPGKEEDEEETESAETEDEKKNGENG